MVLLIRNLLESSVSAFTTCEDQFIVSLEDEHRPISGTAAGNQTYS